MFARSLELKENEIHLIENRNQNKERAAKQVSIIIPIIIYVFLK